MMEYSEGVSKLAMTVSPGNLAVDVTQTTITVILLKKTRWKSSFNICILIRQRTNNEILLFMLWIHTKSNTLKYV